MKIKYLRLNKDERKKIRKEFAISIIGKNVNKYLRIGCICSILCILYSLYIVIEYLIKKTDIINVYLAIVVFCFAIGGFIYAHKIYIKSVNNYLINKKN